MRFLSDHKKFENLNLSSMKIRHMEGIQKTFTDDRFGTIMDFLIDELIIRIDINTNSKPLGFAWFPYLFSKEGFGFDGDG